MASHGGGGIRVNRERALPQVAVVEFPASVDLTLDVAIGAAEGTLDLGGLRISALDLKSGASHTAVSFDSPNAGSCRTAQITSGAGELTIASAGNSGCRSWRFDGGVGAVTVDLDGAWPADARMDMNMALGGGDAAGAEGSRLAGYGERISLGIRREGIHQERQDLHLEQLRVRQAAPRDRGELGDGRGGGGVEVTLLP